MTTALWFRRVALVSLFALIGVSCGDDGSATAGADGTGSDAHEATQGAGGDGDENPGEDSDDPQSFRRLEGIVVTDLSYGGADVDRWDDEVPGIAEVSIPSSVDDHQQPALWLAHDGDGPRPLLVVLHSWGVDYRENLGIPYGRWADQNGWAMIQPDFRGVLDNPDFIGSDAAVQDVIDAIDYAEQHADIDPDQVFITGFSGGGMMSLLVVGRHPDRFAGAVAWAPIHDLGAWHAYWPSADYAIDIERSCGGDPAVDPAADEECLQRSPSAYLDGAREAGVPIYIGHGLDDEIVPTEHSAWAFNQLADDDDRLDEATVAAIEAGRLPPELDGQVEVETYFDHPDPPVLFARRSGPVTFLVFDGVHEGVYHPGLAWMVQLLNDDADRAG